MSEQERRRRPARLLIAGAIAIPVLLLLLMLMAGAIFFGSSASATSCGVAPAGPGGPVRIPMVGPYTVTSEFGIRWGRLHDGIDLSAGGGATIVAAQGGTVSAVGSDGATSGRGNYIHIDAGGGVVHGYFHLVSVPTLAVGTSVATGTPLGTEGNTGHSFGAHLHFQVHVNGTPTNPRDWLTSNGVEVPPLGFSGIGDPPGGGPVDPGDEGEGGSVPPPGFPTILAGYGLEQLINAAWIIKAGQSLSLDAWSIEVGVMTAMGESSLRVLDYGDSAGPDSRGLFQQRDSWGPLAVRMDPTGSSLLFFNALLQVSGYHDLEPTIAAHRVQINADPYHYRPWWSPSVTVVEYFLARQDLLDAMPDTSTGVSTNLAGCKPFLSGIVTRTDLSKTPIARGDELAGFVHEPTWRELEPQEGQYQFEGVAKALEYAAVHGQRVRLRVFPDAPEWVKTIGGPPIPFHYHDGNRDVTIARYWSGDVQAKWHAMITALATAFDAHPALAEVNISGMSAISAEDMLLQLDDKTSDGKTNRQHLLEAGFNDADRDANYLGNVAFFQGVWKATATTIWAHPYRTLETTSMERTKQLVAQFHAQSPHSSFGHTGADQKTVEGTAGPTDLYEYLRDTGPFTIQSRSFGGGYDGNHDLGDLTVIIRWAMANRVMAFELPRGDWQSKLTAELIAEANYAMAANAATWGNPGPDPAGRRPPPLALIIPMLHPAGRLPELAEAA